METTTGTKTEKPKNEGRALTAAGTNSLVPQNFADAEHIALSLAKSDIVPKELIGKPANILLVLMFGAELDMSPAQRLQNIMIVNGRPSLWGDAVMGKVEASGLQDAWRDEYDPNVGGGTVSFTTKRKGREPITRTFSMEDAKKANLAGKPGPWTQYPKRMLFHRARSWALRDAYPDVLKGIRVYEEDRDMIEMVSNGEKNGTSYYELPKVAKAPAPSPESPKPQEAAEPPKAAAGAESAPQEATGNTDTFLVEKVTTTEKGKRTVYCIYIGGTRYETPDVDMGKAAKAFSESKTPVAFVADDGELTEIQAA